MTDFMGVVLNEAFAKKFDASDFPIHSTHGTTNRGCLAQEHVVPNTFWNIDHASYACGTKTSGAENSPCQSENSQWNETCKWKLSEDDAVTEYPNPVCQGGMFAVDEPLDRKREYWTTNLIKMLCQEGIIQEDHKMKLVPSTPVQPYCLSQGVIRLIEQEPEVYILPSFPKGVPGQKGSRGCTYYSEYSQRRSSPSFDYTNLPSQCSNSVPSIAAQGFFERNYLAKHFLSNPLEAEHNQIALDRYVHNKPTYEHRVRHVLEETEMSLQRPNDLQLW